ncbi:F-box only protein 36 isoform X2 [Cricetulus griseus]|uniref:F-box only protein 36 isoform X2 n=1 Tax=Cricetulus griseus TaxID=10029 RepID=A0A9J7JCT1_CRIGR|nr:F-box only protein 36 isoform X2 [Cricetulus griseus]
MPPPLPPSPALRSAPLGSARLGEQPPVSFRRSLQGTRKGTWRCAPYPSAGVTPAPPRQQELNSTWGHPGPDCKTPPKAGILVTRGRGSHHPELKLLPRPHCQGKSGASLQSGAAAPLTPVKPRPFLVVLATAVASQDGVVAAGYSVRNCRTRPGAEQRLLPVVDHSDSVQIALIFGARILDYVFNMCEGKFDYLERLSDKLLLKIICFLELEDIARLSQTSSRFAKLCKCDSLWEQIVQAACDTVSPDMRALAKDVGWRQVFFTNKIQLQRQIRRKKLRQGRQKDKKYA